MDHASGFERRAELRPLALRLKESGYEVRAFPGSRACLRAATRGMPDIDLLITDVIMPGMRGPELVERMREQRPDLQVLFISGYTEREFGDGVPMTLNTNFLEKPFTPDRLLLQVRQTLSAT